MRYNPRYNVGNWPGFNAVAPWPPAGPSSSSVPPPCAPQCPPQFPFMPNTPPLPYNHLQTMPSHTFAANGAISFLESNHPQHNTLNPHPQTPNPTPLCQVEYGHGPFANSKSQLRNLQRFENPPIQTPAASFPPLSISQEIFDFERTAEFLLDNKLITDDLTLKKKLTYFFAKITDNPTSISEQTNDEEKLALIANTVQQTLHIYDKLDKNWQYYISHNPNNPTKPKNIIYCKILKELSSILSLPPASQETLKGIDFYREVLKISRLTKRASETLYEIARSVDLSAEFATLQRTPSTAKVNLSMTLQTETRKIIKIYADNECGPSRFGDHPELFIKTLERFAEDIKKILKFPH